MEQKRIRVGTFNLYNLVLPEVSYYGDRRYTLEAYARKKAWITEQLLRMKVDIVGFQEVFHEQALRDILENSQPYRDFQVITAESTGDKPSVALAARMPILEAQVIPEFPESMQLDIEGVKLPLTHFSRPVLAVRLQLSTMVEAIVFVVHLKSKRPIIPEGADPADPIERAKGQARALIIRATEAIALRQVLMERLQDKDVPVIVLGDMNDSGRAVTSRMISGDPPHRRLSFSQKSEIWDVVLYHVKDIQDRLSYENYYYTHIHNGYHDDIDHIMVSQEFVAQNPKRIGCVEYVSVLNDHLVDETLAPDRIEDWQSDHGQVVTSIELRY
jgi:predicted extracellular nuclease